MSMVFKSIAVLMFVIVAILGVVFGVGLPLNFVM